MEVAFVVFLPVSRRAGFVGDFVVFGVAVFFEEFEEPRPRLPVLPLELLGDAAGELLDVLLPVFFLAGGVADDVFEFGRGVVVVGVVPCREVGLASVVVNLVVRVYPEVSTAGTA